MAIDIKHDHDLYPGKIIYCKTAVKCSFSINEPFIFVYVLSCIVQYSEHHKKNKRGET